jgi:hypothetical protein
MTNLYPFKTTKLLRTWLCLVVLISGKMSIAQQMGFSYVNITKQTVGGTIEPGDVLEIRYNVHFPWNFNQANGKKVYKVRYYDNVPSNTSMNTGATDSLRIITNEGKTFLKYSLAVDADAGNYKPTAVAPEYKIRINIGGAIGGAPSSTTSNLTTNNTGAGTLDLSGSGSGDRPRWWTGCLFSTAFRVTVTGNYGDTISLGGGILMYSLFSNGSGTATKQVPFYKILISKNDPRCTNKVGSNFATESGGTFGTGTFLNRTTGLSYSIPYTYVNNVSSSQAVNDGSYAIVKNTSPKSSTNTNAEHVPNCTTPLNTNNSDCSNRMFTGQWDIIGDHSGQTTGASNSPAGSSTSGGYMLMVNADYVSSEAYRDTISGLCPNTTYEFSAWVKNICSTCGSDVNLTATNTPGVLPSLTFSLDDVDRYGTGDIPYNGLWIKRGFSFTTGPTQTSITFSIRNNAQGGGGNDWVMDDITVSTCQPNLKMNPDDHINVCYGQTAIFDADVSSNFSTYTNWRWEKSTNGGLTWFTELSGVASPVLSGGQYTYNITHPAFVGDSAANGNKIRLRIATTAANLNSPNCSFLANTIVNVLVNNCSWILNADVLQFKAQAINAGVSLRWAAVNEVPGMNYIIEKSTDLSNWKKIMTVPAKAVNQQNNYTELDPGVLRQTTYYRILMSYQDKTQYASQVTVKPVNEIPAGLTINSIQNPFTNSIPFELTAPDNGEAGITLFDLYGKPLKQLNVKVIRGSNRIILQETGSYASGTYILLVRFNDQMVQKKLIKTNR